MASFFTKADFSGLFNNSATGKRQQKTKVEKTKLDEAFSKAALEV